MTVRLEQATKMNPYVPQNRGLLYNNATVLDFDRVRLRLPNVIDHGQAAQEAKQEDAQGRSCW